ncbi:hypothetical protein JH06_1680 [Blastocystis sp. subtype 4]|uniref:hypothetical protein n=1 Tax=Blastocystis sp. subtype 4 TaxID=944170 RepID=UPI0007112DC5|nr:hypothetical protein JH06_1680 [Blastocystis sp. subtype 4]KNB44767.1 hypothetical protein JH06_1680 [Blastocystis sp. subtype 4]|eukprot:XP_014528190.1 hypothetical protein JH06_1680 [Blastocystis sp. subtype 4]
MLKNFAFVLVTIAVAFAVEKVDVHVYYESYCPGCEYLLTNDVNDFYKDESLRAIADIDLVPYGPQFSCQHGEKECYGNYVELCAQKHFADNWWNFIICEEKTTDFTDDGVKKCADEVEGPLLHLDAADRTPEDHEYVPWVVVDGVVMDVEKEKFKKTVCDAYKGEKPDACNEDKKEVKKVDVHIYYESYCPGCEQLITHDVNDFYQDESLRAIADIDLVPYGHSSAVNMCYGNYVELCAQKHFADNWWNFIVCEEKTTDFTDDGVKKCADETGVLL